MGGSLHAKNQLHSSSRFNTTLACDGRTNGWTDRRTHDDSIYRASIASRGKTQVQQRAEPQAGGAHINVGAKDGQTEDGRTPDRCFMMPAVNGYGVMSKQMTRI